MSSTPTDRVTLLAWLQRLRPRQVPMRTHERVLACLGALLGIAGTAIITRWSLGPDFSMPLIIAPMGASAVILFAVPASPLAQPWAVVMGNTLSALVGVAAAATIGDPTLAAAVGVSGAIGVMSFARCVHPPGGAVALTAVLGGPAIAAAGYAFVLAPVAINSVLLTAIGIAFNNATRRRFREQRSVASGEQHYPYVPPPPVQHGTSDPSPQARAGFTLEDIDRALLRYGDALDVSREDLDALFREVALEAHWRKRGAVTCATIMARDLVSVGPDDTVEHAHDLLVEHRLRMLPVLDGHRAVGVVYARTTGASVRAAMHTAFAQATPETPISALLDVLSRGEHHEVLVVDAGGALVGVVTQTDLLAALYRTRVIEAASQV